MRVHTKITLGVSLLAGLMLLGAGYATALRADRQEERRVRQEARLLAGVLKAAAERDLRDHGSMGAVADLVTKHEPTQQVVFFGPDGRAIAPVPREEDPVIYRRVRRVIQRGQPSESFFRLQDRTVYAYRVPLLEPRGLVAGALELRMALDRKPWRYLAHTGSLVAVALLLAFALTVALYTRYALGRPLARLLDGMDHVIRDDLGHVLPLEGSAETERIAYRFNEMTARLRGADDEVRRNAETRLQLEARLRRSEKLATVGQLSAEIAHEVGTPLNVIGGRSRTIARKADQAEVVARNAEIIAVQVERIAKIIQHVLDLARGPAPRRGPVHLRQIVEDAVAFLDDTARKAGVRIACDLPADLPPLAGDADGLQQVVLNLLLNAIQATPETGEVRVEASVVQRRREGLALVAPQSFAAISVADEGAGIPEEDRPHLFEPFFTTKPRGEGTGLGLTVVQGIVKAHDGWVEAEVPEAGGCVFRAYLPLAPGASNRAEATAGSDAPVAESARIGVDR